MKVEQVENLQDYSHKLHYVKLAGEASGTGFKKGLIFFADLRTKPVRLICL